MHFKHFYTPILDKDTLLKASLIFSFLGYNTKDLDIVKNRVSFPIAIYVLEGNRLDFLDDRKSIDTSTSDYHVFKNRHMRLITTEELFNM